MVMFRVYRNRDRELLFKGSVDEAVEAGIRLRLKSNEIVLDGEVRTIVNRWIGGHGASFWVV